VRPVSGADRKLFHAKDAKDAKDAQSFVSMGLCGSAKFFAAQRLLFIRAEARRRGEKGDWRFARRGI